MKGKRVLIVEDDRRNMELMADLIEGAGGEVLPAQSAPEGILLARAVRPDLVLMDVGLPGMDGLTATRILKRDPGVHSVPVLIVTAHVMREDEERILAAGCSGWIPKPIDTRAFVGLCQRCL